MTGELGCGAFDASTQLSRKQGEPAQVGEQWPHRLVDQQGVPGAACGRGEQHRRGDEQVVVQHVDERLE
jgi:hypothetical protein